MSSRAAGDRTETPQPDPALIGIATRLRVSIGAFRRRSHEALSEGDLTGPQLTALSRLERLGAVTTAELARREQITPQAMGATVAVLEERGLVTRSADPADGRRWLLTVTEAGRAVLSSERSAVADTMAAAMATSFTAEEIATLDAAAPLIERLADLF
ncbi:MULTISPECIES: MarR family winged helix-turn-helix transcriptional regulator [Streptomyces]|uniref:MarR family winged helix-turn-helix transcriptional regulator n=1 Tax=Streptomyces lycopersici TaxID=2974589 RepID=UPI0021CF26B8|nr:MarR family transcriptional regulator [Streptomyces sp. NEAU-383]